MNPLQYSQDFAQWFGNSKVADEQGNPLTVYHGTNADIHSFGGEPGSKTGNVTTPLGHFFSPDPGEASRYAIQWNPVGGNVMPVHLSLQNPYEMPYREFDNLAMSVFRKEKTEAEAMAHSVKYREDLKKQGHDGIIVVGPRGRHLEYVAFHPHQIVSAITRQVPKRNPLLRRGYV